MAGGWGYTVQAPMEIPQEPPLRYMDDDMPEVKNPQDQPLPEMKNTDTNMLRRLNKALPPKPGGDIEQRGRMQDAAEYAAAMGQAFAITKSYNQAYAARAKAKGKAAERISKRMPKDALNAGKSRSYRNLAMERYAMQRGAQAFGHHPYGAMY